jgi:hypothetical protein
VVGRHVHRRPMDQSGERGADDLRPVATIEITENGAVVGNGSGPKTRTSARVWVFFFERDSSGSENNILFHGTALYLFNQTLPKVKWNGSILPDS